MTKPKTKHDLSRLTAGYFAVQSLAVVAWWITLRVIPDSRQLFFESGFLESEFWLFLIADLVFVAGGSGWVALTRLNGVSEPPWAQPVIWIVVGAVNYATLCTVNLLYLSQATWLAVFAMLLASAGTTGLAVVEFRAPKKNSTDEDS